MHQRAFERTFTAGGLEGEFFHQRKIVMVRHKEIYHELQYPSRRLVTHSDREENVREHGNDDEGEQEGVKHRRSLGGVPP